MVSIEMNASTDTFEEFFSIYLYGHGVSCSQRLETRPNGPVLLT